MIKVEYRNWYSIVVFACIFFTFANDKTGILNMNNTQQQFFALLKCGLWNTAIDTNLFLGTTDWNAILMMAKMQTVNGVLFDGIMKLPIELQPPVALMRQLYQLVIRTERSHELLNKRLTKVVSLLQLEGICPILFKGQGVAQNYINPIRRQCGDIDLYINVV